MNETIPIMSYGTELCQFANADFKWIVNTKNVNKNMTQAIIYSIYISTMGREIKFDLWS